MAYRRPFTLERTPYLSDCADIIADSDQPDMKRLAQHVQLLNYHQDIGRLFQYDDHTTTQDFGDLSIQISLKGFQHQLEKWEKSNTLDDTMQLLYQFTQMYLHEIILHTPDHDTSIAEFAHDLSHSGPHVECVTNAISSAHGVLECFYKLHVSRTISILDLPTLYMFYAVHACAVLSNIPRLPCANVDRSLLQLDEHINRLTTVLEEAASQGHSYAADRHLYLLSTLIRPR